jgi:type IX secretion system PorP/SprF family membrane protein
MCASALKSQDIHFSDFYATPINTNPALTGVFRGNVRVMGIMRDQYRAVTVPYQTLSLGIDTHKDKIFNTYNKLGFGAVLNADVAGDSRMGTYHFMIPLALHQYSYGAKLHITYGIALGIIWNSLDYENLRFPEQFQGDRYVENSFVFEQKDNPSITYPSFGAGINVRYNFNDITGLSLGTAISNLNNPNASLKGNENVNTYRRLILHGMFRRKIAESVEVLPSAKFQFQGPFVELQPGGQLAYIF